MSAELILLKLYVLHVKLNIYLFDLFIYLNLYLHIFVFGVLTISIR